MTRFSKFLYSFYCCPRPSLEAQVRVAQDMNERERIRDLADHSDLDTHYKHLGGFKER